MPLGTVKTLAELETEIADVIKGSVVDTNKVSSPNHRVLLYDIIATMFNFQSQIGGTFANGYLYAGNPTSPNEGDQRRGVSNGKFITEEYVSGAWILKIDL